MIIKILEASITLHHRLCMAPQRLISRVESNQLQGNSSTVDITYCICKCLMLRSCCLLRY